MSARNIIIGFFSLATLAASPPLMAANASGKPVALVYRGPAGCLGCSEALAHILESSIYGFDVVYVGPGEDIQITATSLRHAVLFAQPGGGDDVPAAAASIGAEALGAVRDFVRNGGYYIGICMGAYLAAAPGYGVIDGVAVSYVGRPGSLVEDDSDTVTPVIWRGEERWMYYQSGSAVIYGPQAKGVDVLARYPNQDIAASVSTFGLGRVGLVGPHPEADQSWYDLAALDSRDGTDEDLAQDLLEAVMDNWPGN